MRLSLRTVRAVGRNPATLDDLAVGESGVLSRIDLPEDDANRLMELGFLPGALIVAARSAPGGDPRVFRVDGTEFALRRDTARKLRVEIGEEGVG
ncbi:MAG: ferrous iron transport protein A [Thermoanaerobaculia bacterium]|nr:ferrous iron transport protein A [Thermoanaerobaculia bacterium]